jgi:hypothetical protein
MVILDYLQFKGKTGKESKSKFLDRCINLLKHGRVQEMIDLIQTVPCKKNCEAKLGSALNYFQTNIEKMNFGIFTVLGLYVGSGVIEAGCKVIVGNRMKNAGMHWSKANAEKMIALRCAIRNNTFLDSYLPKQTLDNDLAA